MIGTKTSKMRDCNKLILAVYVGIKDIMSKSIKVCRNVQVRTYF